MKRDCIIYRRRTSENIKTSVCVMLFGDAIIKRQEKLKEGGILPSARPSSFLHKYVATCELIALSEISPI